MDQEEEHAPDSIAHCGGCNTKYPRAEVRKLKFVSFMDKDNDGDKGLALYNCTCDRPGTFAIDTVPNVYNLAKDIALNQDLRAHGYALPPKSNLPAAHDLPPGKTAEEYYALLARR